MFRIILLAFIACVAAPAVAAQPVQPGSDFRSIVPRGWTLTAPKGHAGERRFVSPRGDAWLSIYAEPADHRPVAAYIDAFRAVPDARITYEREGSGWIVVSGFRGDRIFYRKAMLACGGRRWHQIEFEYPAAEKRAFDEFVTRTSYALQAYQQIGCHPGAR